jgi:hypothetical protein
METTEIKVSGMNYWLLSVGFVLVISTMVFGTEIKSEKSMGKDGEPIVTTYYENEPNGKVKRIQYGAGPRYRLEEQYFGPDARNESGEKNYLLKIEYDNVVYGSDPHSSSFERRVGTFSNDRPDFISQLTDYNLNGYAMTEVKFRLGNPGNRDRQIKALNDKGQTQSVQTYYNDGGDNVEHFKSINSAFLNGVIFGKDIYYYEGRSDYLARDTVVYTTDDTDKPEDQRKIHNEGRNYYDNLTGFQRVVLENEPDGRTFSTTYFDKTKNKDNISQIDDIKLGNQKTNQVILYGTLYKGRIAKSISERGADGLWYSRYFDAAGTEIQP